MEPRAIKEAERKPAMAESLQSLEYEVDLLERSLDTLSAKIAPTLLPCGPASNKDGEDCKMPLTCSLVSQIDSSARRTHMMAMIVMDLVERCQL